MREAGGTFSSANKIRPGRTTSFPPAKKEWRHAPALLSQLPLILPFPRSGAFSRKVRGQPTFATSSRCRPAAEARGRPYENSAQCAYAIITILRLCRARQRDDLRTVLCIVRYFQRAGKSPVCGWSKLNSDRARATGLHGVARASGACRERGVYSADRRIRENQRCGASVLDCDRHGAAIVLCRCWEGELTLA